LEHKNLELFLEVYLEAIEVINIADLKWNIQIAKEDIPRNRLMETKELDERDGFDWNVFKLNPWSQQQVLGVSSLKNFGSLSFFSWKKA